MKSLESAQNLVYGTAFETRRGVEERPSSTAACAYPRHLRSDLRTRPPRLSSRQSRVGNMHSPLVATALLRSPASNHLHGGLVHDERGGVRQCCEPDTRHQTVHERSQSLLPPHGRCGLKHVWSPGSGCLHSVFYDVDWGVVGRTWRRSSGEMTEGGGRYRPLLLRRILRENESPTSKLKIHSIPKEAHLKCRILSPITRARDNGL